jgi:hypothetical protein
MFITVPLSPRLSRLANPLAACDAFLSMPVSILLGMKRAPTNFVKVGSLAQRIACRLIARRQAEIRLDQAGIPTAVEPGNRGEEKIADVGQSRSSGPTRLLNKSAACTRGEGGRGECPRLGENVIQFAAVSWGRRGDRPRQIHGVPARSASADQFMDRAAAAPRTRAIFSYSRHACVPLGGRMRVRGLRGVVRPFAPMARI